MLLKIHGEFKYMIMGLQHVEVEIQQQVASLDEYISDHLACKVPCEEETNTWVDPPKTSLKCQFIPICICQLVREHYTILVPF